MPDNADAETRAAGADVDPANRDDVLAELLRRAETESTVGAWVAYADGLSAVGRFADAISLREQLDEQLMDGPVRERLCLARAGDHLNLGELNVALWQLGGLKETAADPSVRTAAAEQVERIHQQQHDFSEEMRWQRLKTAAVGERIDAGSARYSDHCQLGRSLISLWAAGDPAALPVTVDQVTAAAVAQYPDSAELHELRVLFLLRSPAERNGELDAELMELERLAPDSPLLREFATVSDDQEAEHAAQLWERERSLLQVLFSQPDPGIQAAAVADFRALAGAFPENTQVRAAFGLALALTGHPAEAIEQAEWVIPRVGTSSELQLALGQVFWHAGDHARGREHLRLAWEYAVSDADRAEVDSLRSSLGA